MGKKLSLLIICLFILGSILSACTTAAAKIDPEVSKKLAESVKLWAQYNLRGAEKIYNDILKENPDMPEANYRLAMSEYYYDQKYDEALLHIQRAVDKDPENPDYYETQGEIYSASGDYKKSIDSYKIALSKDKSSSSAYYKLSCSYLKLGMRNDAVKILEEGFKTNPYNGDISNSLHRLYVEDEKYSSAYGVWKAYNMVEAGEKTIGYIGEWNSLYKKALEDSKNHYTLGDIYYKLHLYDEASLELQKAVDGGEEKDTAQMELTEAKAFVTFREDMAKYLDSYYRDCAVKGSYVKNNLYKDLMPIYDKIGVVFPNIEKSEGYSKVRFDEINKCIEEKFGVNITYFNLNGYEECYFGNVISEKVEKISQWGKEADEKVTTIRDMVTNGFNHWYNFHTGGTGGWTQKAGEFVYVFNPMGYVEFYNWGVTDKIRNKMLSDAKGLSPNPDEKGAMDVYYSQYLSIQFVFKYLDSRVEQGKGRGLSGNDLKAYTVGILDNDHYNVQILAHEGQHALDTAFLKLPSNPEYRAKLAEMAYGNDQYNCLGEFMQPNIGNKSDNHGAANQQIFGDMVKYIYDHKDKYPGIDMNKNILSQMINLKPEEIKDMAKNIFNEKFPTSY